MNAKHTLFLTAVSAFAGGLVSGLLFAPTSGRRMRRQLASHAERPAHWVNGQLHGIEQQLERLEHQLAATTAEFGHRLHEARDRTVAQYIPTLAEARAWDLEQDDVAHDLRRMPC